MRSAVPIRQYSAGYNDEPTYDEVKTEKSRVPVGAKDIR